MSAWAVDKAICVEWDPQLWPAGLGAGDRWTTTGTHPALGVWMRVVRDDRKERGGTFADWNGDLAGCVVADLDPGRSYRVELRYEARVNGVLLQAFTNRGPDEDESAGTLPITVVGTVRSPGTPEREVFVADDPHRAPYLAIAGLMMSIDNLGLDAPDPGVPAALRFYPDLGVYNAKAAWIPIFPTTWGTMHGWPTRQKFLIAHEIGHLVETLRDEGHDTSTQVPHCQGWTQRSADGRYLPDEQHCRADVGADEAKGLMSMEYQAMAAREAWADFMAAWAFNLTSEADCVYGEWGNVKDVDLDADPRRGDNDFGDPRFNGWLSCAGIPLDPSLCEAWGARCRPENVPLRLYIDGRDWLEDVARGDDPAGCDPTDLTNRGTAWDWMRFWWDLASTERIPVGDLADLMDAMDLRTADPDDDGDPDQDCGSIATDDDVVQRLLSAAAVTSCGGSSCLEAVNRQRDNGQDH